MLDRASETLPDTGGAATGGPSILLQLPEGGPVESVVAGPLPPAEARVACADCNSALLAVEPGSVHLVNGTPPYWDKVDYELAARGDLNAWRARRSSSGKSLSEYLAESYRTAQLLWEVCAEDSALCLEIDDLWDPEERELILLSDYWREILQAVGFKVFEVVTLARDIRVGNRSGNFVRHGGRPGMFLPCNTTSDLVIATKGDPNGRLRRTWNGQDRIDVAWAQAYLRTDWRIHVPRRKVRPGDHPCRQSPQTAGAAITLLSARGDVVLDPWGGEGTTAIEALRRDRSAIIIERERPWVKKIFQTLGPRARPFDPTVRRAVGPGVQLFLPLGDAVIRAAREAFARTSPGGVTAHQRSQAKFLSELLGVQIPGELWGLFHRSERRHIRTENKKKGAKGGGAKTRKKSARKRVAEPAG